jgi:DNA polymerase bacteriophage-type
MGRGAEQSLYLRAYPTPPLNSVNEVLPMVLPPLEKITLDFETYYDTHYSLKKVPPIQYVRDDRFHVHGCGIKRGNKKTVWVTGSELTEYLTSIDWTKVRAVAHNMLFDGLILAEKYGVFPKEYTCTIGLARALLPPLDKYDLDTLVALLELGAKGKELENSKGKRELTKEEEAELAAYCINDVDLTDGLDDALYPLLPDGEKKLLSMTLRMGCAATFNVDVVLAKEGLEAELTERDELIKASGLTLKTIRSTKQFPAYVKSLGIEPPTKINPKGNEAYAFAKNDLGFHELRADYPQYEHIWKARVAAMSTTSISRAERFVDIGSTGNCKMPMPYNYCGAHTFRWSGAGKINVQNLRRIIQKGGKLIQGHQRMCLIAPPGYRVVVADSSQIELRFNMWFCGQADVLEVLRVNGDVYSHTASKHFGYTVTKKTHPDERQFGKVLDLALGYSMGAPKFRTQTAVGFMGTPPMHMDLGEAYDTVNKYRATHKAIKDMWDHLNDDVLPAIAQPGCYGEEKCLTYRHNSIELPSGLSLHYPGLENYDGQWTYMVGNRPTKIYGGLLLENIIQSLARIPIGEQMLVVDDHPDIHVVGMTHDEIISIVPEGFADEALAYKIDVMSQTPDWAPGLPLSAEGGHDACYSK